MSKKSFPFFILIFFLLSLCFKTVADTQKICIIVNKHLYPSISSFLEYFIIETDKQKDYKVILNSNQFEYKSSWSDKQQLQKAKDLRAYLESMYNSQKIEGAILIGSLPIPQLEVVGKNPFSGDSCQIVFPCDYYYMNFDLDYKDEKNKSNSNILKEGYFDNEKAFVGEYVNTHIWVSRIIAHNLTHLFNPNLTDSENEKILMKKYLYRASERLVTPMDAVNFPKAGGLMVGVEDLSPSLPYPIDKYLYPEDTKSRWVKGLQKGYEVAIVLEHSMVNGHKFKNKEGLEFKSSEYAKMSPPPLTPFFFTNGCAAGKYSHPNCMNATYVMGHEGLAGYGWTTLAGCHKFIRKELKIGMSFGKALLSSIRGHRLLAPHQISLIGAGNLRLMPYKLTNKGMSTTDLPPEQSYPLIEYGRTFVQSTDGKRIYFFNENKLYAINTSNKQVYGPINMSLTYSANKLVGVPVIVPTSSSTTDRLIFTYRKRIYWCNVKSTETNKTKIASSIKHSEDFDYNLWPKIDINPDDEDVVFVTGCTNFFISGVVDNKAKMWAYDMSKTTDPVLWSYPKKDPIPGQFSAPKIYKSVVLFTATYGPGIRGNLYGLKPVEGTLVWANPIRVFDDRAQITGVTTIGKTSGSDFVFVKGGDCSRSTLMETSQRIVKFRGSTYPHQRANVVREYIFNGTSSSPGDIIEFPLTKDVCLTTINGSYVYEGYTNGVNHYFSTEIVECFRYVGGLTPWYTCYTEDHWETLAEHWGSTDSKPVLGSAYDGTMYIIKEKSLKAYNTETGVRFWEKHITSPSSWNTSSLLLLNSGPAKGDLYCFFDNKANIVKTNSCTDSHNKRVSEFAIKSNIIEWLFDTDEIWEDIGFSNVVGWEKINNYLKTSNSDISTFSTGILGDKNIVVKFDQDSVKDSVITTEIVKAKRDSNRVEVELNLGYEDTYGMDWSDNSTLEVSLCDQANNNLYTVNFRPTDLKLSQKSLKLYKNNSTLLKESAVGKATPNGENCKFIGLKMILYPTMSGHTSGISVLVNNRDSEGYCEYINISDDEHKIFHHINIKYTTGNASIYNTIALDDIRVSVYPTAPQVSVVGQPYSQILNEGESFSTNIEATGAGRLEYIWYNGNGDIVDHNYTGTFDINVVNFSDDGAYKCVVLGEGRGAESDEFTITVNPANIWASGQWCSVGDVVKYNNELWKCKFSHTTQMGWYPGAPGIWFWEELTDEYWVANKYYKIGDNVIHNNKTWVNTYIHMSQDNWSPGTPDIWFWEEEI